MDYFAPIEAEYEDGYVHSEIELNDTSPYEEHKNVFYDILNGLPEKEHGRMVRFSMFMPEERYDIDWRDIPDNARPIRYKHMAFSQEVNPVTGKIIAEYTELEGVDFGYQYTDQNGKNIQEVRSI